MAREVRQTTVFRRGEVGAKSFHANDPDPFFNGFIQADEALYYGDGIAKRPPIQFISRYFFGDEDQEIVVLSTPNKPEERETKIIAFNVSGTWHLFYLRDETIELVHPHVCADIVSGQGEGAKIIIDTDDALEVNQFYKLYAGSQELDTIIVTESLGNNRYAAEALVGEKVYYVPGECTLCRIRHNTTTIDLRYNDVIPYYSYNLYIRDANSYTVDVDGAITTTPTLPSGAVAITDLVGKTATVHRNAIAIGKPNNANSNITISIHADVNGAYKNTTNNLQSYYGSELYWIRDGTKGLVIASNQGIFLANIVPATAGDGFILANLSRVTYRQAADTEPVLYRDFILFLDAGRRAVMFVSFDRFEANAAVETLASVVDILSDEDSIEQLSVLHFNDIAVLLLRSSLGVCVAGNIQLKSIDNTGSVSYSRWFVDYNVKSISVLRYGGRNDALLWLGGVSGQGLIGLIREQPSPMFRNKKENRDPHLDFFRVLNTDDILGVRPVLKLTVTSLDGTVSINANSDWFNTLHHEIIISDAVHTVRVGTIFDSRNAEGYILNNSACVPENYPGSTYLQHRDYPIGTEIVFGRYDISFDNIIGISYLYFLGRTGKRVVGVSGNSVIETDRIFSDNILRFSSYISSSVTIGVAYTFDIITAPLSFSGRLTSYKGNFEVAVETVGYNKPYFYLQAYNQYTPAVAAVVDRTQDLVREDFFRHTVTNLPCGTTTRPMIRLFCDSAFAIFITALSVSVGNADV